jgi:hypothetical protein
MNSSSFDQSSEFIVPLIVTYMKISHDLLAGIKSKLFATWLADTIWAAASPARGIQSSSK